jgi:hypothetical protein
VIGGVTEEGRRIVGILTEGIGIGVVNGSPDGRKKDQMFLEEEG